MVLIDFYLTWSILQHNFRWWEKLYVTRDHFIIFGKRLCTGLIHKAQLTTLKSYVTQMLSYTLFVMDCNKRKTLPCDGLCGLWQEKNTVVRTVMHWKRLLKILRNKEVIWWELKNLLGKIRLLVNCNNWNSLNIFIAI